jgi:hypothetical protein
MTKIKNIAVALSMIVLFAGTSFAGTTTNNSLPIVVEEPTVEPLVVNYMGEDADYLYFKVSVKSGSNKFVTLAVSDKSEGELYTTVFSTDKEQTFKIEKRNNQELDFNLSAGKKSYSKSFTIMPRVTLARL